MENIPLNEAVARGIIPCSVCGASGADVRKVGDKNHFLCSRCARRGRVWTLVLTALTILLVALGGYVVLKKKTPHDAALPPELKGDPEPWMKETSRLMKQGRFREARERTLDLLEKMPKDPMLNLTMGRCLMNLGAVDSAIPYFLTVLSGDPQYKADASVWIGMAYKKIGHAAQAVVHLEPYLATDPAGGPELAEVYLDLERYDEALKLLPDPADTATLWARHRALVYLGKGEDAKKLLDSREEMEVATLRVSQLREEGKFADAAKVLESLSGKVQPGSPAWHRARRAELSLAVEAGDLARIDAVTAEFASDKDVQIQGEGVFSRTLGHLLAGRRDAAKASAWEFLAKTDKEFSPLRLERMMMRHLVGELKDADLEAETKLLSRFHANDLLWYLALATGERAWAEKAAAATPGHNYPYHAIQRMLKK